ASRELELQELRTANEHERGQSHRALRDTLAKAETAWKADTARRLTEAEAQARDRAQGEMHQTLTEAEAAWRAEAIRQLAEAEAKWQQKLQRSLADAKTQNDVAAGQADDLHRLRNECGVLKDALVTSEAALAKMQTTAQEERQHRRHELEKALI